MATPTTYYSNAASISAPEQSRAGYAYARGAADIQGNAIMNQEDFEGQSSLELAKDAEKYATIARASDEASRTPEENSLDLKIKNLGEKLADVGNIADTATKRAMPSLLKMTDGNIATGSGTRNEAIFKEIVGREAENEAMKRYLTLKDIQDKTAKKYSIAPEILTNAPLTNEAKRAMQFENRNKKRSNLATIAPTRFSNLGAWNNKIIGNVQDEAGATAAQATQASIAAAQSTNSLIGTGISAAGQVISSMMPKMPMM